MGRCPGGYGEIDTEAQCRVAKAYLLGTTQWVQGTSFGAFGSDKPRKCYWLTSGSNEDIRFNTAVPAGTNVAAGDETTGPKSVCALLGLCSLLIVNRGHHHVQPCQAALDPIVTPYHTVCNYHPTQLDVALKASKGSDQLSPEPLPRQRVNVHENVKGELRSAQFCTCDSGVCALTLVYILLRERKQHLQTTTHIPHSNGLCGSWKWGDTDDTCNLMSEAMLTDSGSSTFGGIRWRKSRADGPARHACHMSSHATVLSHTMPTAHTNTRTTPIHAHRRTVVCNTDGVTPAVKRCFCGDAICTTGQACDGISCLDCK